jgi:hypothetical protein
MGTILGRIAVAAAEVIAATLLAEAFKVLRD